MNELVELKDGEVLVFKQLPAGDLPAPIVAKDGSITSVLSTEIVDSDGDVVHQGKTKKGRGWILSRFNKAPVISWVHDMFTPNLSGPKTRVKVVKHDKLGKTLQANPVQFDSPEDPFATFIEGKVQRKSIVETSVGFKGIISDKIENGTGWSNREYFEQELLEFGYVNRGANPETETAIKSMLKRRDVTPSIETAGDAELTELKEEIAELSELLEATKNALCAGHEALEARIVTCEKVSTVLNQHQKSRDTAVAGLYARMKSVGLVHAD